MKTTHIPKLIETSLPLEAIDEASMHERSIRHGKDVWVMIFSVSGLTSFPKLLIY